jgi:hypothetical protein
VDCVSLGETLLIQGSLLQTRPTHVMDGW